MKKTKKPVTKKSVPATKKKPVKKPVTKKFQKVLIKKAKKELKSATKKPVIKATIGTGMTTMTTFKPSKILVLAHAQDVLRTKKPAKKPKESKKSTIAQIKKIALKCKVSVKDLKLIVEKFLPDTDKHINRFVLKRSESKRIYTVAQSKDTGNWYCSAAYHPAIHNKTKTLSDWMPKLLKLTGNQDIAKKAMAKEMDKAATALFTPDEESAIFRSASNAWSEMASDAAELGATDINSAIELILDADRIVNLGGLNRILYRKICDLDCNVVDKFMKKNKSEWF